MYPDEEAALLQPFSSVEPIFTVNPDHVQRASALAKQDSRPCASALKALVAEADEALKQEPLTIVNKPIVPASDDKHDYMSVGPYWWPDPDKDDGLPYIRRDGEVNPETKNTDHPLLTKLVATVNTLGIAYRFTQREDYAKHAGLLLRTWFLDAETKMNPNLLFGQAIPGICDGRGIGLIETTGFASSLLPAVGFLADSESWTDEDMAGLQAWFHAFLEWMLTHPYGVDEARHGNNHSSAYDVQVTTYALFVGQPDLARAILKGVGERRIADQIKPDGQQPRELSRTKSLNYSTMNLELLLTLAELGLQWGVDVIHYESADGRSIRQAFDWMYPRWIGEQEWTHQQIVSFPKGRAFKCMRLAAHLFVDAELDPVNTERTGMDQDEVDQNVYNLLMPPHEGRYRSMPRVAEDVVIRDPEMFVDPAFINGDVSLSEDEIAFFKENGFLIKRGFLREKETFERIVDYVWENVPRNLLKRDDPKTWLGAPHDQWTEEDAEKLGLFGGGAWKMRSRNGIGTESFFLDEIANHPRMQKQVSLFIGNPVKQLKRVRGVYCVFPKSPDKEGNLAPHADHTAAKLSAMVVVDEIPPHCGGFTIWPGSHRVVYSFCKTTHGYVDPDQAEEYALARDDVLRNTTPLELGGQAGDVIFWHPHLMHSGGINCSAAFEKPVVRLIVPCDFQCDGYTFVDDLVSGPGPNHQWWVDTRMFREDVPATAENMWNTWAFDTGL